MNLLHTQNLQITIGKKIICRDLTLQIRAGEIWGILGQNGSGKTTLLHTLARLHPAMRGEIWVGEKKLKALSIKSLAQQIGILFQDFNDTFPQTVWEYCLAARYPHLAYFKKESAKDKDIVTQALQTMELCELIERKITQLSGGEKRRLALAAILAQTPLVYLLDEPTNHLDVRYQFHVLNQLKNMATTQTVAVMMSLHDINLAQQFCNRILLLFADGYVLQGCPEETLTQENLTRLYQFPIKRIADQEAASCWMHRI